MTASGQVRDYMNTYKYLLSQTVQTQNTIQIQQEAAILKNIQTLSATSRKRRATVLNLHHTGLTLTTKLSPTL